MNIHPDKFFKEVTTRISSSLDAGEALASTFEYLKTYMPIHRMMLGYVDHHRSALYFVAEVSSKSGIIRYSESKPKAKLNMEALEYINNKVLKEGDVTIHNRSLGQSYNEPDVLRNAFQDLENSSAIAMILRIKSKMIGGLFITAEGLGRYNQKHARMMDLVKEPLAIAMSNARRYHELVRYQKILADDHRALSRDLVRYSGTEVIGADFGLRGVMDMVRRVAGMSSPVLLLGETGTGKEIIANSIHLSSPRREAPMIRVQCGAIPDTLLDSELFGHEKGAFTGALDTKRGRFERAHGGTIFLDEIGELTPEAQVKLLRVLQEREIERLGGSHTINVDVRVIAATHRDLAEMVQQEKFREDLWFRLNVFPIFIPPLRQRREDIPSLVHHFIHTRTREMGKSRIPQLRSGTMAELKAYDWPGNVRELQNIIERALILSQGEFLEMPSLLNPKTANPETTVATSLSQLKSLDDALTEHIRRALDICHGKINGPGGAAESLGINPNTLRSKMKKLGISRYNK